MWNSDKESKDIVAEIPQPQTNLWLIFGVSAATVIVVLSLAWFSGFLSPVNSSNAAGIQNSSTADLRIKGNKSSRIYHLTNCPNYNDISERNVVWFKTIQEAKDAGYRIARNCP